MCSDRWRILQANVSVGQPQWWSSASDELVEEVVEVGVCPLVVDGSMESRCGAVGVVELFDEFVSADWFVGFTLWRLQGGSSDLVAEAELERFV